MRFLPYGQLVRVSVTHAKTAVDRDDGASNVRGVLGRDELDNRSDFVRGGEAAGRYARKVGLLQVSRQLGGHLCLDEAGGNHVGSEPTPTQLARDRPRQPDK